VKWRTGSEGRISSLKRGYGWDRTRLDGTEGARIWTGQGVFALQPGQDRGPGQLIGPGRETGICRIGRRRPPISAQRVFQVEVARHRAAQATKRPESELLGSSVEHPIVQDGAGEGDDFTGRGAASAPHCAGLPSCGRWCNGPLPEPPGGLSFDGLAVWSVVF